MFLFSLTLCKTLFFARSFQLFFTHPFGTTFPNFEGISDLLFGKSKFQIIPVHNFRYFSERSRWTPLALLFPIPRVHLRTWW